MVWRELSTSRLLLRPLAAEDVDDLVRLHSDPKVTRFIGLFGNLDAGERIVAAEQHWATHGYGLMAVLNRNDGGFVGRCGLQNLPDRDEVELGWTLRRDAWGKGLATEAARACLAWAFDDIALTTVVSLIHPENGPAEHVAAKLGMHHDGATTLHGIDVNRFRAIRPSRDL